jgi:DNA-directed RNA polymerase specialized sigma24 family protein
MEITGGVCRAVDGRTISRAARGDAEAFGLLVGAHSGLVRGVASCIVGREDVEDACQEVWFRAWRGVDDARSCKRERLRIFLPRSWVHKDYGSKPKRTLTSGIRSSWNLTP